MSVIGLSKESKENYTLLKMIYFYLLTNPLRRVVEIRGKDGKVQKL